MSCPGQSSRSYNWNTDNGFGSNYTYSNPMIPPSGASSSDQKAQIPLAAIIAVALLAMFFLGLVIFECFRRKNKGRKGGAGLLGRVRDEKRSLGHSPGRSQAPFSRHNTGVPVHQNLVQPTSSDTGSSAVHSYDGENPTPPIQNTSQQSLHSSSVLAATNHQQGQEDPAAEHKLRSF